MKEIVYNHDNLKEQDIDETVVRVKALLVNSNNEIALGYCHKTFQFPGGHLEKNETLEQGLKREIKEETGINIKETNLKPFEKITYYSKNYRNSELNRKNEIYYFSIYTDEKANINNTNLDNWEKEGNYKIEYINLEKVEQVLINSIPDNPINRIVVEEMLEVLNEYEKRIRNLC